MNTTRFIEATTLVSIGALCAAAILTLAVPARAHSATTHAVASNDVMQLAPVTIVGKRLTAAEKAEMKAHKDVKVTI